MAKISGKKAGCLIATILLLLLSIASFAVMLGLGAWGIVQAQVANPCGARTSASAGCEPALTVLAAQDDTPVQHVEWTYWLGGATGVGVVWTIVQTFAIVTLVATCRSSNEQETEPTSGADGSEQETFTFGNIKKTTFQAKPQQEFNPGAGFGLFFSLFFFVLAVLLLLWSIAISYDYTRRDDGTVGTFVVVEFIAAVALPLCLFVCGILMAAVLDFITLGQVDLRLFIPKFLPVVKFESGTDKDGKARDFWVIEDTLYFEVPVRKPKKNYFLSSFDHSSATWFLTGILWLGVHLAVAFFVDTTLDVQTTIQSPDGCDTIDSTYQCFEAGSLLNTQCGSMYFNGTIHCFKFLRFGADMDLIMAIFLSYVFYLTTSTMFTYLFSVIKIILHIKPSKAWGGGFVIAGEIAFVGGLILAIFWFYGYAAPEVQEITHFNIINLAQYFMVCAYIVMVGFLLVTLSYHLATTRQRESVPMTHVSTEQKNSTV